MSAPLPAPLPVPAPIAAPLPAPMAAPPSVAHALAVIASSPSPIVVVIMRFFSIAILLPIRRPGPAHDSPLSSAGFAGAMLIWGEESGPEDDAAEGAEVGAGGALHVGDGDGLDLAAVALGIRAAHALHLVEAQVP